MSALCITRNDQLCSREVVMCETFDSLSALIYATTYIACKIATEYSDRSIWATQIGQLMSYAQLVRATKACTPQDIHNV